MPEDTGAPTRATTIDAFLTAVTAGVGIPADVYAPGAVLDATVPNWRYRTCGAEAIAAEYGRWYADPGRFEQLRRIPLTNGELVVYLLTWSQDGVPHASHHCHLLEFDDDGKIAVDTVFCGGRWPAALLAAMEAAA